MSMQPLPEGIRAVLFDLDGTLLDHFRPMPELCEESYAPFADSLKPIDSQTFWQTYWSKSADLWNLVMDGALPGETARLYAFVNTLRALHCDDALAETMLSTWSAVSLNGTRLSEGAMQVLDRLRSAGIRTGIVTNGYTVVQRTKATHHDLEAHVDFMLVSEEVGSAKPSLPIFSTALSRAGAASNETVFVGDSLTGDVHGARQAGLYAVLIDRGDDVGRGDLLRDPRDGRREPDDTA